VEPIGRPCNKFHSKPGKSFVNRDGGEKGNQFRPDMIEPSAARIHPPERRSTALFGDIRFHVARLYDQIVATRRRVFITALLALLVVTACKYALVGLMLQEGASRAQLRLQDAFTAGVLAAFAMWVALAVGHFRQKQIRDQIQTVADLNHHLRNALTIILNSQYLTAHEQKDAILAGVDRIDRALQRIVPSQGKPAQRGVEGKATGETHARRAEFHHKDSHGGE
jgi:hypothetical protein